MINSNILEDFEAFVVQVLQLKMSVNIAGLELESLPQYDSMSQLVIAAWIHQETGHLVSIEELKGAKTIGDLKAIYVSKV